MRNTEIEPLPTPTCPRCGNNKNIATERRPNGDSECMKSHITMTGCGFKGATVLFKPQQNPNVNDIKGYRKLPEGDLEVINGIKEMENALGDIVGALEKDPEFDKRWIGIGRTHLQQGFMALVRGIAQPESRL